VNVAKKPFLNPKIEDLDVGDIVRLNSATLRMTVDKIAPANESGAIECVWFDDSDTLQTAAFHPSQLVIVNKVDEV
jgi:uncharacterized protein YodC (DUF2158 family)